jgi:hypothetical protein
MRFLSFARMLEVYILRYTQPRFHYSSPSFD